MEKLKAYTEKDFEIYEILTDWNVLENETPWSRLRAVLLKRYRDRLITTRIKQNISVQNTGNVYEISINPAV